MAGPSVQSEIRINHREESTLPSSSGVRRARLRRRLEVAERRLATTGTAVGLTGRPRALGRPIGWYGSGDMQQWCVAIDFPVSIECSTSEPAAHPQCRDLSVTTDEEQDQPSVCNTVVPIGTSKVERTTVGATGATRRHPMSGEEESAVDVVGGGRAARRRARPVRPDLHCAVGGTLELGAGTDDGAVADRAPGQGRDTGMSGGALLSVTCMTPPVFSKAGVGPATPAEHPTFIEAGTPKSAV